MTQRESFEKLDVNNDLDTYVIEKAWEAYQAGQAALIRDIVEKLNEKICNEDNCTDGGHIEHNQALIVAIEIVRKAGE